MRYCFLLLLMSLLAACAGPGYYLQAASGHFRTMHARQDIQALLAEPSTDPELKQRLQTARQILAFAENDLGLEASNSYDSYVEVDGDALVWNVVATPEFSLTPKRWCFPVAGCVPYKGYFKQHKAGSYAEKLAKKGMDVYVSPAAAYSSLGWFRDPLLSTMLEGSQTRLAAYLFHELAHQRLYIRGDGRFNESYASFVEDVAVRSWLVATDQAREIERRETQQKISREFREMIKQLRLQLTELYQTQQPEAVLRESKAALLTAFRTLLNEMRELQWQGKAYYSSWSDGTLNNARLALFSTYEGGHCAFQELWKEAGKDMEVFHALARRQSRLSDADRTEWLAQSCSDIAQATNL